MFSQSPYRQASIKTAEDLRSVAQSLALQEVSQLSLPEIDALVNAVSSVVPAGNVPGIILSGLARLPGRQLPDETVRRDINLLFKGVESALDKAMYGALFAGPAAIIWGYQNLLKLAGKEPKDSFPEGVWQFYVEYALREDTARHTCETGDFDAMLAQHQITLSPVDRTTAWLMAAITVLHQYPELLANEWRERVFLALLADLTAAQPDAVHYAALYSRWQRQRPFRRDKDAAANENFASYRRRKFDAFLAAQTRDLDMSVYQSWTAAIEARREELRAYKQQLSIHTYLAPGPYHEERVQIPRSQLQIGLIYQGRYYLLPACAPGGSKPAEVEQVRKRP